MARFEKFSHSNFESNLAAFSGMADRRCIKLPIVHCLAFHKVLSERYKRRMIESLCPPSSTRLIGFELQDQNISIPAKFELPPTQSTDAKAERCAVVREKLSRLLHSLASHTYIIFHSSNSCCKDMKMHPPSKIQTESWESFHKRHGSQRSPTSGAFAVAWMAARNATAGILAC